MNPRLRQLEVFRLLMRIRNVTETAKTLRISQPAVSATIKELEQQFGLQLFLRRGGRLHPTVEATQLLPDVERLFLQVHTLQSRAQELIDAQAGSLSVAGIPTLMSRVLPHALARFMAHRPRFRVQLAGLTAREIISLIKQETLDVGFVYLPTDEPAIAVEPLFKTKLVCLVPRDHPLARRRMLNAAQLEKEKLLTQAAHTPPGFAFRESFGSWESPQSGAIETNMSICLASLVREKLGIGVTDPIILCSPAGAGLSGVPYDPDSYLTLAAVYSRHRAVSRGVLNFVAAVREEFDQLVIELSARKLFGERI